jgi:hypothetical protein
MGILVSLTDQVLTGIRGSRAAAPLAVPDAEPRRSSRPRADRPNLRRSRQPRRDSVVGLRWLA